MIVRRAIRDLRAIGVRAILVVLAIALAAGTGSGASLTASNVRGALDSFYSEYHLADLELSMRRLRPESALLADAERAGATRAAARLVIPGTIKFKGGMRTALFVGMAAHSPLNQLQILQGKGLDHLGRNGVVMEADFAKTHNLSVGSWVALEVNGFGRRVRVEGIGRTPEALFASADPEYFVLQRGSLANVYVPLRKMQTETSWATGTAEGVNVLLVDLPPGRGSARERQLVRGEPVYQLIPRDQQFGYRATQLNLAGLSSFTPMLTAVLASVAILLIAVTMMRLVQAQRRELGMMLALGHKRSTVILTAVLPALALGLFGGLLAIPACVAVAKLMATQFSSSYGFLPVPTKLTFDAAALAVALSLGTSLVAAIFPAVILSRLTPAEALRGDTPATHRLPNWVRAATGTVGTPWTYGLRNIVRTPVRSSLTVLSLAGAIGLGISLHIVSSSVRTASDSWFSAQSWTHTAVLQEPMLKADALSIGWGARASRVEPFVSGTVELMDRGKRLAFVNVVGSPRAPQLQSIGLPSDGLKRGTTYVSQQLATEFDLEVGQRISLVGPGGKTSATIAGTANTLAEESSYLPLRSAQDLLGQAGKFTTLLVAGGEGTGLALRSSPAAAKVVSKSTVRSGLENLISQLTVLLNTVVAIALAVGALFLISSLAMSVLERQGEFAILRALGWGVPALAVVVVVESIALTACGALLGCLLAPAIASPLMQSLSSAWFHVGYDLRATNFLLVVAPALVLAVLVALQTTFRISRLDIAAATRMRTVG